MPFECRFHLGGLIGINSLFEALIIRERILGDSHPDTHHYLRLRGAYYLDIGRF